MYPEPEWLIDGTPRAVQIEALRRSYYGWGRDTDRHSIGKPWIIRADGKPAQGWGHLLEMRLGKTPLILNEFELFRRDYGFTKLIVIAPNTYKEDWALEAVKYGVSVPVLAYEQSRLKDAEKFVAVAKGEFALIINYESTYYDKTLEFVGPLIDDKTLLVADESIKLKNPNGLFFKGAMLLRQNAGATRIATGLPITQGPQDFYGQARFIGMYSGRNYYAYRGRFCKMGGYKAKAIVGARNEEELKRDIDANAFVAKRVDWGNPTGAEYYVLRLGMHKEQKRHYDALDVDFMTLLDDGTEISAEQVMGQLMKLQQISSGFVYDENGRAVDIVTPGKTPKIRRLLEMMEDEIPGKVVVPFHYSKSGDALLEALAAYHPAVIRGGPWMQRQGRDVVEEKRRFNEDPECRVMLLQISAGKYGHDLSGTADGRCSTMVFFENTYSLDDRGQIEARNTTAFQDWSNVYFDMVSSPVEQRAITALTRKEAVVDAVLGSYRSRQMG